MAVESVSKVFEENIANRLESKPELAAQIGASYKFEVTGDGGGTWLVNLKEGNGSVSAGDGEADCHITVDSADFLAIINGELNGQMAFMSGKLKVQGDMMLAMKLGSILGS
ncbi:MAG: SCP2 sterol-binding domain-containing protein [Deltaproteobacteria bacterium]|jgi:putative sterol carrier protein|nr:SCP2 sterol-binding domain-containing protein [Deltaproteobacteria bacterium]MBT6434178.1 SCP2 sterol-binding domain-containing protein [Deltaproteobacteria bacterium]